MRDTTTSATLHSRTGARLRWGMRAVGVAAILYALVSPTGWLGEPPWWSRTARIVAHGTEHSGSSRPEPVPRRVPRPGRERYTVALGLGGLAVVIASWWRRPARTTTPGAARFDARRLLAIPAHVACVAFLASSVSSWEEVVLSQRGFLAIHEGPNEPATVPRILIAAVMTVGTAWVVVSSYRRPRFRWTLALAPLSLNWLLAGYPHVWRS
jgi:hypothetical protein